MDHRTFRLKGGYSTTELIQSTRKPLIVNNILMRALKDFRELVLNLKFASNLVKVENKLLSS